MASHVVSNIMLHPEKWQRDILERRFHYAKQAYNRVLDEWLKRRKDYISSYEYNQLVEDDETTREDFGPILEKYGFYPPNSNGQITAKDKNKLFGGATIRTDWCSDIAYHIPSEPLRIIAGYAAQAVWMYHKELDWGKPSPKFNPPPLIACGPTIGLIDIEGVAKIGGPQGGADTLKVPVDTSSLESDKIKESLERRSKYPREMVCRKIIDGKPQYALNITCSGHAPLSPGTVVKDGVVGVDVGPSKVAAVGPDDAWLGPILNRAFIKDHAQGLRRINRKIDRQRRANNPHMFDDKGEYTGGGEWKTSNRLIESYLEQKEKYRALLEDRKRQHYELAKHLLSLGNKFVVEDNAYAGWQAGLFGSQVGDFAPATFINRLEEKAEAAGGWVKRISTWDTALSQNCQCGRKSKKPLDVRIHSCNCGIEMDRDLYSAYLARFCTDGELDADQARKDWSKLEQALQSAWRESQAMSRSVA